MAHTIGKKAKLFKYYEYFVTKINLLIKQKTFLYGNTHIKYILEESEDGNGLIVILSSCTRKGIKARYNYMRTLKGISANKLFILDDFAADKRGSYYMGENFTFNEETATKSLIEKIAKEVNASKVIFCGSSKGGWASMNFGLQFDNSYIVSGAPQYFLGDYLKASGNLDALAHIVGEETPEKVDKINHYLEQRIINNPYKENQKIFLHYSDKDHTYFEHIRFMLEELKKHNYSVCEDVEHYENHSDVSLYFPTFLTKTIGQILEENG